MAGEDEEDDCEGAMGKDVDDDEEEVRVDSSVYMSPSEKRDEVLKES